jgi:dTDP-4-dehydrorhamnose reductase
MAAAAQDWGAAFVTVSTDYVFGDGFTEPIAETAVAEPLSVYGRSKLEGERLALAQCERAFVVRTTGLYSHRRHNFVKTMLKHARAGNPLTVVNDQFVSPTWVAPLARVLADLPRKGAPGTYHAVAHGGASWFEYAQKIFEVFGVDADLSGIDQDSWGAAAARPSYSVLDNAMLRKVGLDLFEPWDEALERFGREYGLETVVAG